MKRKEAPGTIYGDFEIIDRDEEKTKIKQRAFYNVRCIKCGNIKNISGTDLRNRCNTCQLCKKQEYWQEEVGKKYGKLTVINFAFIGKDRKYNYLCRCDCGNEEIANVTQLHSGTKYQCAKCSTLNKQPQYINEIGNKYGKLTVLERDLKKSTKEAYWKCQCECGSVITVLGTHLREGHTQSCGCIKSQGEELITKILTKNKINFKKQIAFNDCKDKGFLRFDFGVYSGNQLLYLIEYDGIQHFSYNGRGWNTKDKFETLKKRDKIKNEYCQKNNIPLIRIPYTHYEKININDLLLDKSDFIFKEGVE